MAKISRRNKPDDAGGVDNIIDELQLVERCCARGARLLDGAKPAMEAINKVCEAFDRSSSGSWLGYQACVYYRDFEPRPLDAVFSIMWGVRERRIANPTTGEWREYVYEGVIDEILERAGAPDLDELAQTGDEATAVFTQCQEEVLATIDAALASQDDKRLTELRHTIADLKAFYSPESLAQSSCPKREWRTHDHVASEQGLRAPPHVAIRAQAQSIFSRGFALRELEGATRRTKLYLQKRLNLDGRSVARTNGTVFIGHGGSKTWRDLKDLLQDRLGLTPDEFNLESAAGISTKERLEEMLESAIFAFLVMTAEDEHADGTRHARENVIHEAGLFQGRLGFARAIVLLEEGCSEFSNIEGLGQIRFPKGNIKAKSEEIRHVLERQGLLDGSSGKARRR